MWRQYDIEWPSVYSLGYLLYCQGILYLFQIIENCFFYLILQHFWNLAQTTGTVQQVISSLDVALYLKSEQLWTWRKWKKTVGFIYEINSWEQGICLSHEYCSFLVGMPIYPLGLWRPQGNVILEFNISTSISE